MHYRRTCLSLLLALPTAMMAQSEPSGPRTPESSTPPAVQAGPEEAIRELATKREELTQITQTIGEIQSRAETVEEVKESRDKYRETLQAEMVRAAPDMKNDIERQAELVSELSTPTPAPDAEEKTAEVEKEQQQKLSEYRTLHEKLTPVEEGVRDVPAVQTMRKEYYDKLIAEMQRIEPRTQELLAKHRELVAVVRELAAQAQTG